MSKELEALDKIAYSYGYDENILIINKSLKALEIIKKKCLTIPKNELPKDEDNLLKEVLL